MIIASDSFQYTIKVKTVLAAWSIWFSEAEKCFVKLILDYTYIYVCMYIYIYVYTQTYKHIYILKYLYSFWKSYFK